MRTGKALADWVDERLGTRALGQALFGRRIPLVRGWSGWLYTLGSVSLFLFILQAATGMFLAMDYAPTPDHAYDAVAYLSQRAMLGALVRGLHHWGASAMVAVVALHLLSVFFLGSYKYPRELTWVAGVFLLVAVLLFDFTGYLLPWNQKAYWATVVGTNITRQIPVVGDLLARALRGGGQVGPQTLTRFYAFHVLALPALIAAFLAAHLFMVVRQGISAPPVRGGGPPAGDLRARRLSEMERYHAAKEAGEPFYPYSLAKDVAAVLLAFAAVMVLAWWLPPEAGEIADPTSANYNPRPDWCFLFLFQALKYFPGRLEPLAAVVLPAIALALLLLLPFIDRDLRRHPLERPIASALALCAVAGVAALSIAGARSPLLSPYVPEPPLVMRGKRLFRQLHCKYCHSVNGRGGVIGPDLALASLPKRGQAWVAAHLKDPRRVMPGSPMPALHLLPEQKAALIAYLEELRGGGPYGPEAPTLFRTHCMACHRLRGRGGVVGPDLSGIGLVHEQWFLDRYIEDPRKVLSTARMPAFLKPNGPLTARQIDDLARYLAVQRGVATAPPLGRGGSADGT